MVLVVRDSVKFKLLLWKNWRLIRRRKMQLFAQIVIPAIFMLVVFVVRALFDPKEIEDSIIYPEITLSLDTIREKNPDAKIKITEWKLAYSPQNLLFEKIVSQSATDLGLEGTVPFPDAKRLHEYLVNNDVIAGIEFDDKLIFATELPKKFIYSIRFPAEERLNQNIFRLPTWETANFFDIEHFGGPRLPELVAGGYPAYIDEGFAAIQNAIAMNFINTIGDQTFPEIKMKRMPVTAHVYDTITHIYINVLGLLVLLSFMYTAGLNARYIATEKEMKLREIMKIMGIRNALHWLAWFIIAYCLMFISCIFVVIMLKIPINKGFAVLPNSDFTALIFLFAVYCLVSVAFFFMIGTFFPKANTANFAASFLWFLGYFPFQFVEANYMNISEGTKYVISLIPNSGLCFAFKLVLRLEASGVGFNWKNLLSPSRADDNLRISTIMLIMILATILEIIAALYFEKVHPGEYGVPEKWYFPFTKRFWIKKRRNIEEEDKREAFMELFGEIPNRDENKFEPNPLNKRVGIIIRKLWKIYGKNVAVNNLSVNLFKNEITILLGHNGAGKTSTISILTGMIPPTKGTAILDGFDIRTQMNEARQSLGLCPQYNILFDELTVREHIIFYSRLKGLEPRAIRTEVNKYVKILNLENKIDKQSSTLSGGMKRKLSVASALCGNSQVVLLDEPSSGMDPAARRSLWDIIQSEKRNRTILLSTHFMEEAEALGDRIAIMQGGVLDCFGTSYFLKKKFGVGYHLICIKKPNCDVSKITTLLATYIPEIEVESDIGTELSYRLPDSYSKNFETILSKIETQANDLNLDGYGISLTTLEDVFMKVGTEKKNMDDVQRSSKIDANSFHLDEYGNPIILLKGIKLRLSQWRAIILKKLLFVRSGYKMHLISWFFGSLIILLTIYQTILYKSLKPINQLVINLGDYRGSITPIGVVLDNLNVPDATQEVQKQYLNYITDYGNQFKIEIVNSDMDEYLLQFGEKNIIIYKEFFLIGATMLPDKFIAWFNNDPLHCVPLSLNIFHNAIARSIDPEYNIEVINKPLPYRVETQLTDAQSGFNFGFMFACNVCIAMSFITAIYCVLPVKEIENRSKLLQFVSGCRSTIYWLGTYIIDLITLFITMIIMIIILATFHETGFATLNELSRLALIFALYASAVLPLYYVLALGMHVSAPAYAKISIMNLVTGIIPFFLIYMLAALGVIKDIHKINHIFYILPHYNLACSLLNLYSLGSTKEICDHICLDFQTEGNCTASILCETGEKLCCLKGFFDSKPPGCLLNMLYYAGEGIILFCILLIMESKIFDKAYYKIHNPHRLPESIYYGDKSKQDSDVVEEEKKIKGMTAQEIKKENLIVFGLTKYYKKFAAVNNLYLQVKNFECFGLLGVNGAGKTSTFKMLTGDSKINYGAVFVKGMSITQNIRSVYRRIGYCPQFDALMEDLSGREVMKVYCLLRGIPADKINRVTNKLAVAFGYIKHIDKKVKNYSGGNKRKLSTSIALLGNPVVVYLDEPTTGMDPGARRQLWDVICKVRDSGTSVILTSHSMEECEALCSRLAIMVNGEFKCIGSIQHLKNKFSKGIVLKIKLKITDDDLISVSFLSVANANELSDKISMVQAFVENEFPNSILKERFQGILTFHITVENIQWSKIFGIMEKNKERLDIEDYSINQTTLESIFLDLAKTQFANKQL